MYFSTIRDGHDWGGDFSIYVMQARNFAEHRPFDQNSYVVTAESAVHHPAVYPPLTSLILVPIYAVKGLDYRAFKVELIAFLWLSVPVYYVLALRRKLTPESAAISLCIFGLSPIMFTVKESVGSDSVFLFVTGLTILLIDQVYQDGWDKRRPVIAGTVVATGLTLCYTTRATGLVLIASFAVYDLWRQRGVRLFGAVVLSATACALLLYTQLVFHVGEQYGNQFTFSPKLYLSNIGFYLRSPAILWGNAPPVMRYPLSLALILLAIAGWIRQLRERLTIVEIFVPFSILLLVVYSVTTNTRYMLPVLPFVLLYAAAELRDLYLKFFASTRTRQLVMGACATVVLTGVAFNLSAIETGPIREGILEPSFADVCSFVRDKTPADALIVSWNPRVFALYTGRKSALYPQTEKLREFEKRVPHSFSTYVVYYSRQPDQERFRSLIGQAGPAFTPVFTNNDYRVYILSRSEC